MISLSTTVKIYFTLTPPLKKQIFRGAGSIRALKIGKDMETFWKILTQYLSHIYTTSGEVSNFSSGGAQSAQYSTP